MPISRNFFKIPVIFLICALALSLLGGCGSTPGRKTERFQESDFLMDTVVSITYFDANDAPAVQNAMALCRSYERIFSRTDPESELYRLNECDRMTVSDDLLSALETALDFCRRTDGVFDITMGGVSALYGFSSETPAVPESDVLSEALSHVGYENLRIDGNTVTIGDAEAVIDLGAAAKGYIADRIKEQLAADGVEHAIIDLGGNILCLGGKPDGSAFRVGIRDPLGDASSSVAVVSVREESVVTSGVYERGFEENGVHYHHILDSETGDSVRSGLLSVSILGPESLYCDILSTVCFVLGAQEGMALIETLDGYEALFVTEQAELIASPGFDTMIAK